jgi:acetyl-CoA C-acetyltransferase
MTPAVIVSTARTPPGQELEGRLQHDPRRHAGRPRGQGTRSSAPASTAAEVDDVIMGCANPEGATGANIARQIALRAGCPSPLSGMTVNRFCSSGLQTIALAAQRVIAGEGDIYVAGGVESISCVQQEMNQHMMADPGWSRTSPRSTGTCCRPPSRWPSATASAAT